MNKNLKRDLYINLEDEFYDRLAASFYNLVKNLDFEDKILINGIGEGLNKFLSNAYIKSFKDKSKNEVYKGVSKFYTTQYVSKEAKIALDNKEFDKLYFEHIIPKVVYQDKIIKGINKGELIVSDISKMLKKYMIIATITKDESKNLNFPTSMPQEWEWDECKNFIRYTEKYTKDRNNIELISNDYLEKLYVEL